MVFNIQFKRRVRVIIDCFEIFIEWLSDLNARTQTWSSYKHHNTVKYLTGITPQGSICYISNGWGGHTSDKHITTNSDFLGFLSYGDVVLADRGFDIKEVTAVHGADTLNPSFTTGKKQLSAVEVQETRKIANVRIHVERVIGNARQKYFTT